ncbi:hypothetical protein NRK68_03460 [Streptomyces yangpuensis]|uniref:Transposase of IS4/5 family n=1 Tax=Streptomyces yangpuensis TaxID=1648182 RepID=A0ABY5PQD5_9ACTN|nr:hypothetical protein [Streptomyces yangpuensis]UUY46356.1 hypothetical protein NRK68_03460 [Streptomyces yangpuensis]
MIDVIAFKCRIGTPWMDLSERFSSCQRLHDRLPVWVTDGTWE